MTWIFQLSLPGVVNASTALKLKLSAPPDPGHLQLAPAESAVGAQVGEAAKAGAATAMATMGTVHAAPRASVRRETW